MIVDCLGSGVVGESAERTTGLQPTKLHEAIAKGQTQAGHKQEKDFVTLSLSPKCHERLTRLQDPYTYRSSEPQTDTG